MTLSRGDASESEFDAKRYVAEMTAARKAAELSRRRETQRPYKRLIIASLLSLCWTPLIIFGVYAVDWSGGIPAVAPRGIEKFQAWPWIVGAIVVTAYSLFYGLAALLAARESAESYRVAIGSFYGLWIWLPIFLMYPGIERLGVSSDGEGVWAFVLIGLGQTVYAWVVGRFAEPLTNAPPNFT